MGEWLPLWPAEGVLLTRGGGAAGSGIEYIGTRIREHLYQKMRPGVKVPCVPNETSSPQTKLAWRCTSPGAKTVKKEPPSYPSLVPRSGTKFLCLYLSLLEEYYNSQCFLLRPRPEGKSWGPIREQSAFLQHCPFGVMGAAPAKVKMSRDCFLHLAEPFAHREKQKSPNVETEVTPQEMSPLSRLSGSLRGNIHTPLAKVFTAQEVMRGPSLLQNLQV